jgi:hypothetical protein
MPVSNWVLAVAACFMFVMIHLRYVPITYRGTEQSFWRDGSRRILISKVLFASLAIEIPLCPASFSGSFSESGMA